MRWLLALGLVAAAALAGLGVVREGWPVLEGDIWLEERRRALPGWAHEAGLWLDRLGGHWVLPPVVAIAVIVAWWCGRRGDAVLLVAASAGADLFLHAIKALVDTDRAGEGTTLPSTAAFPSGHATTALTIAVTLALVTSRDRGQRLRQAGVGLAAGLAVAVAAGRWLDGRRAASDVVGGLLVGLVWLAAASLLRARGRPRPHG